MKILKEVKTIELRCPNCTSTLEVEPTDICSETKSGLGTFLLNLLLCEFSWSDTRFWITCPSCQDKRAVVHADIPDSWEVKQACKKCVDQINKIDNI